MRHRNGTFTQHNSFSRRDLVGSPSAGDVTSFFHVFGSLSFVVILVTYFYNILGQVMLCAVVDSK